MNQKKHLKIFYAVWVILLVLLLSPQKTFAATLEELQSLTGRMEADCAGIEPATRTLRDLSSQIETLEESKDRNQATYDGMRSECGTTITLEDCQHQLDLIASQISQLMDLYSRRSTEAGKAQIEVDKCKAAMEASGTAAGSMTGGPTTPVEFTSPIAAVSPTQILGKVIKTVLGILGAIALAMFVYGGFVWMTSGGSPEKIKTARTTLVWAVLGMAVIFLSYAAVDFVLSAFGV